MANLFSRLFIAAVILHSYSINAQENLVPNHSFEELNGKPKKIGEIDKVSYWSSPTAGTAEIFWSGSKSDDIKAPKNSIGYQYPKSGDNYAGIIMYDQKNANLREYIQVELTDELEEGKIYCVEFFVSIADLSKYSIDLIGAHLSSKRISVSTMDPINVVPQIQNKPGRLMNDQNDWEIICGEYMATGGEKYLTIGNFNMDKQFQVGKMKKPRDVPGAQNDYGYYYIDDVSVIEQDADYVCDCYKKINKVSGAMNVVYSKVTNENEEVLKPENLIESKVIRYEADKYDLPASAIKDLNVIVKLMNENPSFKLEIIGFAEDVEVEKYEFVHEQRAQKVREYLDKQGVRSDRLSVKHMKGKAIVSGLRKVEFKVKK